MKAHLVSIAKSEAPEDQKVAASEVGPIGESPPASTPKRRRIGEGFSRKALAIIVIELVVVSSASISWALFLKPWSTEEVGNQVINDPTSDAPGFRHGLAGRTVTVVGHLTELETYDTSSGRINLLTLDGYEYVRLVIWGPTEYEPGDLVRMPVHFEWATCNDERHIYSPQVDFPWFYMFSMGTVIEAVSAVAGTVFTAEDIGEGKLRVSVFDHSSSTNIAQVNCTLKEGERSWMGEYMDVLDAWGYGRVVDEIPSLANGTSDNGLLTFSDSDHDGTLSKGDWIDLGGIERPSEDAGMKSYMLNLGYPDPDGLFSPGGVCYLVVTHDGLVRLLPQLPYARIELENRSSGAVEATIASMSAPKSWDNVTIQITDGISYETWTPQAAQLTGGPPVESNLSDVLLNGLAVYCVVKDQQGNGLMDEGDSFVIGTSIGTFSAKTNYTVTMIWEPMMSQLCIGKSFHG